MTATSTTRHAHTGCWACHGTGWRALSDATVTPCEHCDRGRRVRVLRDQRAAERAARMRGERTQRRERA